jgi:dihydrofolate synthase/folylpolyglutamate synthase
MGAMDTEAADAVRHQAEQVGAPLVPASGAVEVLGVDRGRARVRPTPPRWHGLAPVALSLLGRHQVENAATTVRLLDVLASRAVRMPAEAVVQGLVDARWPARLEWLRLSGGELLIDAAHNPAGAEALASYLVDAGGPPLPIVMAAMQDKDVDRMVAPLARVVSRFITTSVPTPRAFAPGTLAERIRAAVPGVPVTSMTQADTAVRAALGDGGRAVAAGSIYFVGPLRARLLASGAVPI